MALVQRKPIDITSFIDADMFCEMRGISRRTLAYRLLVDQVHPRPSKFGTKHIFRQDAQIIIPERKKGGGRPKGSTVANGANRPGVKPKKAVKKIIWKNKKIV